MVRAVPTLPTDLDDVAGRWSQGVRFAACNVDDSPDTAMLLQVQPIPTVVAFDVDGNEIVRIVDVSSKATLEEFVADPAAEKTHGVG